MGVINTQSRNVLALSLGLWLLIVINLPATQTVSEWRPLFKGISHATMKQVPGNEDAEYLYVSVLRVDLTDPDIQLFSTPPITNYQAGIRETEPSTVSEFVEKYRVQVAVNANLSLGEEGGVLGLHISQGQIVGPARDSRAICSLYFTTNKEPFLYPTNWPARSTAGIYTAVTGLYPLLINGVVVANNAKSTAPGPNPRTALGYSQDKRTLIVMTIDGRQPGWSYGSEDEETAYWLQYFGAHDGVNMDGGGATTMSQADCLGHGVRLNRPSDLLRPSPGERSVPSHLGVFAKPLSESISAVTVETEDGLAFIRWTSPEPASSQIFYGSTTNYGKSTPLDSFLTLDHEVIIEGLTPGLTHFFKIVSAGASETYTAESCFSVKFTLEPVFDFGQVWRFQTNSLNGIPWTTPNYNDSGWLGSGPGLLYFDNNAEISPKGTVLPSLTASRVPITYYFRTHFTNTLQTQPYSLTFSNYIDDGAVFYLNGKEIQRVRMAASPVIISATSLASGYSCSNGIQGTTLGDAVPQCPTVFTVTGNSLTNLLLGDNVLAVEVHNYASNSPDVVFGTSLFVTPAASPKPPKLTVTLQPGNKAQIRWAGGQGLVLQSTRNLSGNSLSWSNVVGDASSISPVLVPLDSGARYFRLRSP